MAKVSELKEQARAFEVQGEAAKALAVYQHILTHLEGTPAFTSELPLYVKCGDLMLKLGDSAAALSMYETAGEKFAAIGSARSVLAAGTKIQRLAPERTDVYLLLGRRMVEHGHAGPAVDVLIEHAKQANLDQILQELEPLAGRSSEDVAPRVKMLLDSEWGAAQPPAGGARVQPLGAVEAPPPPDQPPAAPAEPMTPPMIELAGQFEMPPSGAPQFAAPPPRPAMPPAPPLSAPPPLVSAPEPTGLLDLMPPLPPSQRESQQIDMRASAQWRIPTPPPAAEEPAPRRARPSVQARPSQARVTGQRRAVASPPRWHPLRWIGAAAVAIAVGVGLAYVGVLPIRLPGLARTAASDAPATKAVPTPTDRRSSPVRTPSTRARAPTGGAPVERLRAPPVLIQGLVVESFSQPPQGESFSVVQRQPSGQPITLVGRPLADTIGELSPGEVRVGGVRGDTAAVTTGFEGYAITLRGVMSPTELQALLRGLVSQAPD